MLAETVTRMCTVSIGRKVAAVVISGRIIPGNSMTEVFPGRHRQPDSTARLRRMTTT